MRARHAFLSASPHAPFHSARPHGLRSCTSWYVPSLSPSSSTRSSEYAWPCTMPCADTSASLPEGDPAPSRYPMSAYFFTRRNRAPDAMSALAAASVMSTRDPTEPATKAHKPSCTTPPSMAAYEP